FYSTDFYASQMIDYLKATPRTRPFFAYLAFTAPHWPLQAPEALIRKYLPLYKDGPQALRTRRLAGLAREGLVAANVLPHEFVPQAAAWSQLDDSARAREARKMAIFAAMVDRLDTAVGRVIAQLRRSGELDRTVIFFMSDNGAEGHDLAALPDFHDWVMGFDQSLSHMGRPGSFVWYGADWAQAATAPSRLYKGYPTEGGIHVPAFVWRSGLAATGINHSLVSIMDVTPTLLDLAGVPDAGEEFRHKPVHAIEGHSLRPLLEGRRDAVRGEQDALGWELFGRSAIRVGQWKAVQLGQHPADTHWELYDLASDPAESHDLSASLPDRARLLGEMWHRYVEQNKVILPDTLSGY
ncbi:MAG: arylsulfatase, partial [Pseudomonadota bacterium]